MELLQFFFPLTQLSTNARALSTSCCGKMEGARAPSSPKPPAPAGCWLSLGRPGRARAKREHLAYCMWGNLTSQGTWKPGREFLAFAIFSRKRLFSVGFWLLFWTRLKTFQSKSTPRRILTEFWFWLHFNWILAEIWLNFSWILAEFWLNFGWILAEFWLNFGWILTNFDWILTEFDWILTAYKIIHQ